MSKPIDTFKKIKGKSWSEIRTRGEQAISARTEQIGLRAKLPSDEEFVQLLDKSFFKSGNFGEGKIKAQHFLDKFYQNARHAFFPAFNEKEKTLEAFRRRFGEKSASFFVEKAKSVTEGKFDLLGFKNLSFGNDINWHLDPISGKQSPLKHWKQFDELSTEETGDKKVVWELNRHQYFFTLGVAFWLTDDEQYAETFSNHLENWMRENPPGMGINWFSSLEVAFRAVSWIWAFNFFKDSKSLAPELFYKALKFLYLHGRHIEKYLSTFYSPNTHLTGEALGLYYLGTQLPFLERATVWRETGENILTAELDRQILADGVYFEQSTWYARYTADFYTHFLLLKALNEGEEAKMESAKKLRDKLQYSLDFLMYVTCPDGTTPLVGDDDGGRMLPHGNAASDDFRATLATGAVLFGRGDYKFVARDPAEETLWLLGADGIQDFEKMSEDYPAKISCEFASGGYFVMREGWTDTDNYLLVDCGAIGSLSGGHGHADALAIELAVAGRKMLVDSGTYTYNETIELRNYFRSTTAHNTLTIDGKSSSETGGKFNWQTKANANLKRWISQDRFDFFEGSQDGYERLENPATHTRSILFLKNDYWIIRDFVKTSGRHEYALNFHFDSKTQPEIEKAENGNFCVDEMREAEVGLRLFTFGDNGNWQRRESWISDCYGRRSNAPLLRFVSSGVGAQEFFTFLLPNEGSLNAPQVLETEIKGGRAFVINYRGYQDLFVFADGSEIIRTEFFNTNFNFFWARLSEGEDLPEEFVMVGGTQFVLNGREVINYPKPLEFAAARRFGSKLNIRAAESVFSVSIPQKRSSAYVLKSGD